MDQLKVLAGPAAGRVCPLDRARLYVIGREATVDLSFPDPTMSREHAGLAFEPTRGWVLAIRSQHGVLAGGTVVHNEVVLSPAVPVTIGGTTLVLESAPAGASPPTPVGTPVALASAAPLVLPIREGPSWVPPCCCGCAAYVGCSALSFAIIMGLSAALWEAHVQRELNAKDTSLVASIAAPILGLLAGLVVLLLMRLRENRKAG